ncbi:MtrB/PioB family decaheme-associated outer membrane protein [Ferrimonas sp. YFM]|uniref:MtrB/PioB family decaheme-associated outer membrane protein n=1 Tax=Ferrimonas sp. YFM TaxID=3028878 RepID=UPI002572D2FC|nr:MtrB/PioB family decaheme-associated outer membrane protein [Ferrimonas sp. YFM]BDY04571.1 membrane protein [Ferrimonas sp. YFM]
MRFKLNLITLTLMSMGGSVLAADFSVQGANTQQVAFENYQCKRCAQHTGLQGEAGVGIGWTDADDIHAGNRFGRDDEGALASVNADLAYRGDNALLTQARASDLGLDNGSASVRLSHGDDYAATGRYRRMTQYESEAQSNLWFSDDQLLPSDQTRELKLYRQRQQLGLGLEANLAKSLSAFADYQYEEKQGQQSASLLTNGVTNFALPVDSDTQSIDAGLRLSGEHWFSELSYHGSFYRNQIDHLSLPAFPDVYAATPDNDAHQVQLKGQYRLNQTAIRGHIAAGRMIQDDQLATSIGNTLLNWDGEVDTLNAQLGFTSVLTPKWRLTGQWDYQDRDNRGTSANWTQLEVNEVSGALRQNRPLDINKQTAKLSTSYRINASYRLSGGVEFRTTDRNFSERETTDESKVWAKLKARLVPSLTLELLSRYEERDGSAYQSGRWTSPDTNPLLRKYHLADRERLYGQLTLAHQPTDWLLLNLSGHFANDDYSDTVLGLTGSDDYGFEARASVSLSPQLHLYGSGSQQWIDSDLAGASSAGSPLWNTEIQDEFITLAAGMGYGGLMDGRLSFGIDYRFSNSDSDTRVDGSGYGDDYAFSHSVDCYTDYQVNNRLALSLKYSYERYFDTDNTAVEPEAINGVVTLGTLEHNYNAHLLMLSASYKLP